MTWEEPLQPVNEGETSNRTEPMQEPEEVRAMLRLHEQGWGSRRIANALGVSRNTVKHYIRQGQWKPYDASQRRCTLDELQDWLRQQFFLHRGNADVLRQELQRVHELSVSLRTVQRAVAAWRPELDALTQATIRFETPPGRQMQIDFGSTAVRIGDQIERIKLFVATLGFSRRLFVAAFHHERQAAWFRGMEGAFQHFGGVTEDVLIDNAKALVILHNPETREVKFHNRFLAFSRYWGFNPRACAPYRPQTKGKDERGVGYVKHNAIAGRPFSSWPHLEEHLVVWNREIADVRIHGTTGERPIDRFEQQEKAALQPLPKKAPFLQVRELQRRVPRDLLVEVDTNRYSVPWRLLGTSVTVVISEQTLQIFHAGQLVAQHPQRCGRHEISRDPGHFEGMSPRRAEPEALPFLEPTAELLRDLSEYEQAAGGAF